MRSNSVSAGDKTSKGRCEGEKRIVLAINISTRYIYAKTDKYSVQC
jgi:hypothetical protein